MINLKTTKKLQILYLAIFVAFFILNSCKKDELLLIDKTGKILPDEISTSSESLVLYKSKEKFTNQYVFSLYFVKSENELIHTALFIRKPDKPVNRVFQNIHTQDLAPGKYKIELLKENKKIKEKYFYIK
jgi:uncharacterized lipoprotein YajG